jgi:ubiquinone/menaquinone biosynthesis C-methylase UbiE
MWGRRDAEYRPFPRESRRDEAHGTGEVPLLLALLELPPGLSILELGCGPASTLVPFATRLAPARLCGIDIDDDLLTIAAARLATAEAEAELHNGDARALPFDDASFDVVFDFGTCFHIARPQAALAESARVLVDGGLFVTETKFNQALSHPLRSFGRTLPWSSVPMLTPWFETLMWNVRVKR